MPVPSPRVAAVVAHADRRLQPEKIA